MAASSRRQAPGIRLCPERFVHWLASDKSTQRVRESPQSGLPLHRSNEIQGVIKNLTLPLFVAENKSVAI